jgi:general secretion pathway protein D
MKTHAHARRSLGRAASAAIAAVSLTLGVVPVAWAAPPTRGRTAPSTDDPTPAPRPTPTAKPAAPGARPSAGAPNAAPPPAGGTAPGAGGELTGDEGGTGYNKCRKQPKGARFRITLPEEAELKDLVNWMMSISCQKFILDLKARSGKVTVLSPEPVTVEEAYGAFYAALQTMGLTVEPSGEYFKIVETTDAKGRTLPVYGPDGRAPDNDRFVTQLYRVKGGNTKDVADLAGKLKTKNGAVETVGDLLIITDSGAAVRRTLRIVRQVDTAELSGEKIFFFQLQHADPEETAEIIREIFGEKEKAAAASKARTSSTSKAGAAGAAGGDPSFSRVIVDERSNTLIIVARSEDYAVIRRLIEQLDVPLSGGSGRIHVVKLKNADPDEVAAVLTQLGQGGGASGARAGGGAGGRGAAGGRAGGNTPAAPGSPDQDTFTGDFRVTADPATRSLVILASQNDFRSLLKVIEALDAERKQVYIEVYLMELSINKNIEGGASGHFGATFDTSAGQGLGFVASAPDPSSNSVILSPAILNGIAAGVLGPQIPGSGQFLGTGQDIPAFGVVIQAIQNDTDVNLVAEPHLYTADNQEASIEVGRNVPTQGGLSFPGGGQGGGLVPVQSIQRQDVTLNVKVTPHVNDEKTVTLDIEMENNDIEAIDPVLGVTTTKRRLKLDKVVGHDDVPIVLGGLVQEVEREGVVQVPGLGSIPLLGWLFKRKTKSKQKVNLLMVLVPHILDTPDDARRVHERRMKERLEFLERETAFKRKDLSTNVNYRKKSGLLAEVNREAVHMLDEQDAIQAAEAELAQEEITGEIGLSPAYYEEDEEVAAEEPSTGTTPPPASTARPAAKPSTSGAGRGRKAQ